MFQTTNQLDVVTTSTFLEIGLDPEYDNLMAWSSFFQQEHMPPTVAWCNYRRLAENTETRNQGISTINANINRVM